MKSFQQIMISKIVDLLSILKEDYCSKNYIKGLLSPTSISTYPRTPINPTFVKKSYIPTFSSNNSRFKNSQIAINNRKNNEGDKHSAANLILKENLKINSVKKIRNLSLKAMSTKTQKKKKKTNKLKKSFKNKKFKSGSPYKSKDSKNSRYMSVLKYIDPENPQRFWMTGTLGRLKKKRKVKKNKSNSLNMKQRKKQKLSLSNLRKHCEENELFSDDFMRPGRESKINKVY